eukprot:Gb_23226 [translate_table: standard]
MRPTTYSRWHCAIGSWAFEGTLSQLHSAENANYWAGSKHRSIFLCKQFGGTPELGPGAASPLLSVMISLLGSLISWSLLSTDKVPLALLAEFSLQSPHLSLSCYLPSKGWLENASELDDLQQWQQDGWGSPVDQEPPRWVNDKKNQPSPPPNVALMACLHVV